MSLLSDPLRDHRPGDLSARWDAGHWQNELNQFGLANGIAVPDLNTQQSWLLRGDMNPLEGFINYNRFVYNNTAGTADQHAEYLQNRGGMNSGDTVFGPGGVASDEQIAQRDNHRATFAGLTPDGRQIEGWLQPGDAFAPQSAQNPDALNWSPTAFDPSLGMYSDPDHPGRPKRQMPNVFGINSVAGALASAYNDLMGYGITHEEDVGEANTWRATDHGVKVDPWSGAVTGMGYQSISDFAPPEDADPEKLARFNQAREAYDTVWGQVQEQYLSPTIDKQLRELMPDDGKSYNNAFTENYDKHVNTLNYALKARGIDDLRQIAATEHDGKTVFYNRATGQQVDPDLFNYKGGSGDGNVTFRLKALPDGQVTFDTNFKAPSKWANGGFMDILAPMAFSFALGPVSGMLGKALAPGLGAAAQGAIGGAITGGLSSAVFGGDPLKGALMGGAAGGVGNAVAGKYLTAQGVNPALMSPSPQLAQHAGLLGQVSGGAAADLVAGQNPIDRYKNLTGLAPVAKTLLG